jgi:hypothetical protein
MREKRKKKEALRKQLMKEEGRKKEGDRRKRRGMCRERERGRKLYGKGTCKWFVGASDEGMGEEERKDDGGNKEEVRKREGVQRGCNG